jgi:hypothetical protein
MKMKTRDIFFTLVLGLGLATCAPPTVPTRPSWDVDVFPILQGSCNHCHGETVGRLVGQPVGRLDVCDPAPFVDAGIMPTGLLGAKIEGALFEANLKPVMGATRPSMPPPPAAELSDYERDVLIKWGKDQNADKCNKQARNHEPDMRMIGDPVWDGDDLKLQIEVWDPDQDQVLGKITVGAATALIPSSGRREVVVSGADRNARIQVLLHDGIVSRSFEFDL